MHRNEKRMNKRDRAVFGAHRFNFGYARLFSHKTNRIPNKFRIPQKRHQMLLSSDIMIFIYYNYRIL